MKKITILTQYRDSAEKIMDNLNENYALAPEFIGQAIWGNMESNLPDRPDYNEQTDLNSLKHL